MHTLRQVYRGSPGTRPGRAAWGADFAAGKPLAVRIPIRVPAGRSILRGVATIKRNLTDTDAQAVIQKVVTTTLTSSGQVTDTGAGDRRGEVLFDFTASQTLLFVTPHYYSFDIVLDNGDVLDVESGQVFMPRLASQTPAGAGVIDHIDITPPAVGVVLGASQLFTATPRDAANVALTGRVVDWFTTDSSIATVDSTGLVTTLAEGFVRIGAAIEGVVGFADLTVSVDDVALMIANNGGNTRWPGIYDSRRNVRHVSNAVYVWDDARCLTSTGRLVTGVDAYYDVATNLFDNVSKLSGIVWGQGLNVELAGGVIGGLQLPVAAGSAFEVYHYAVTGFVDTYIGAGLANYGRLTLPANHRGKNIMLAWVYDGTLATNADRLKVYYRLYDKSTQTWGPLIQGVLAFTGTIPATTGASVTGSLRIGAAINAGYRGAGAYDEIRLWSGTALSQAQLDQETLAAAPNAPGLRWTFDGNLNNIGSVAGHTFVRSTGSFDGYCSDDIRWGDPFYTAGSSKPTYDPSALTITFDGGDDMMSCQGDAAALITGDCGIVYGGTIPSFVAQEYFFNWSNSYDTNGSPFTLAAYTDATIAVVAEGGPLALAVAYPAAGRRAWHTWRARAGGNVTLSNRIGSGAAQNDTEATGTDTIGRHIVLGGRPDMITGTTGFVARVFAIRKGDYLTAVQDDVNAWLELRHAVLLS